MNLSPALLRARTHNISGMDERRYSEDEVQEILKRASAAAHGGYTHDELVRMADELGLSPEAIEIAKQDLAADRTRLESEKQDKAFLEEYTRNKRFELRTHWMVFICVNLFLTGIWFVTSRGYYWPIWPLMGWGLGLGIHTGVALSHDENEFQSWKRRKIKKLKKLESGIEVGDDDLEEVVPFKSGITVGIHLGDKPKSVITINNSNPEADEVRRKIAEYKKMGFAPPPDTTNQNQNRLG